MNDFDTNMVDGQSDQTPAVGTETATLVPVVAEADGVLVGVDAAADGEHVSEGDVIAFVQTDEDA